MSTVKEANIVKEMEEVKAKIGAIVNKNNSTESISADALDSNLEAAKEAAREYNALSLKLQIEELSMTDNPLYEAAKKYSYPIIKVGQDADNKAILKAEPALTPFKADVLTKKIKSINADWMTVAREVRLALLAITGTALECGVKYTEEEQETINRLNMAHNAHIADPAKPDPFGDRNICSLMSTMYVAMVGEKAKFNGKEVEPKAMNKDLAFIKQTFAVHAKSVGAIDAIKDSKFYALCFETLHCKIEGKPYVLNNANVKNNVVEAKAEPKAEAKPKAKKSKAAKAKAEPKAEATAEAVA